eukprot:10496326-Alexandrium_andersonii.AAC.1
MCTKGVARSAAESSSERSGGKRKIAVPEGLRIRIKELRASVLKEQGKALCACLERPGARPRGARLPLLRLRLLQ